MQVGLQPIVHPLTVFALEAAAVVILFYSLPSWLLFRGRSASLLSGVGTLLFLLSGLGLLVNGVRSGSGNLSVSGLSYLDKISRFLGLATVLFALLLIAAATYLARSEEQQIFQN